MSVTDAESPATTSITVLGQEVTVPVEVRSAKMIGGTFTVPGSAAQNMIDYSGLKAIRIAGTLGLCMLSAVQYTDNDLGPYNEIALAIAIEPPDEPGGTTKAGGADDADDDAVMTAGGNMTTFIHRLPVNQEFTCAAGRDIWGFPKWVADITYREHRGRTDVVMMDDGEFVMSLSVGKTAVPTPASEMDLSCYSFREGVLRRTTWTMRLGKTRMRPGGIQVEVGHGTPMAEDLRTLGFPKRALMSQSAGRLGCTFGPAEVVTLKPKPNKKPSAK